MKTGMAKPTIDPKGIDTPPNAVEIALYLSPNHTLAILLEVFKKQTYPNAASAVPNVIVIKLPVGNTMSRAHAPTMRKEAPILSVV